MNIAHFEKVSEDRFYRDSGSAGFLEGATDALNNIVVIPRRSTKCSAGYDFVSSIKIILMPGDSMLIPTGIRCKMDGNWVLMLYPRSSMGFKGLRLLNTTGIIDADYYNAKNEGHIMAKVINDSELPLRIDAGERFIQGVFVQYGTADEEEVTTERTTGTGIANEVHTYEI